jgi:hypothetical protein
METNTDPQHCSKTLVFSPYRIGINTKPTTGTSTIGGTGRIGVQNELTTRYPRLPYSFTTTGLDEKIYVQHCGKRVCTLHT